MNEFTVVFLLLLASALGVQLWLARRQARHVGAHRASVPPPFDDRISLQDHQKAADYTLAKLHFGRIELFISYLLLLLWTLGGGLNLIDALWRQLQLPLLTSGVLFMLSSFLLMGLLELPFSAYRTFVLEARFGFNTTTPGVFVTDLFKNTLLTAVIGTPLLTLILWLMDNAGSGWWLYAWAVWTGFSLLMMWAYPAVIAPLFNKFQPLEDATLRQRIESLLARCGFASNGIFVMDGSRRSSHGNAYFTGLGANKRIVFFDTLLKSLNHDETEAVLAHELGHFKRRHIVKHMVVMFSLSLIGLALLGWLMQQSWFYHGLGIETPSMHCALMLFLLVMPLVGLFIHPVMSAVFRKHEFEADDFAALQCDPRHLVSALVKLYQENASTLTPDPLYSAFYDSHPPAPVRVAHLQDKPSGTPLTDSAA